MLRGPEHGWIRVIIPIIEMRTIEPLLPVAVDTLQMRKFVLLSPHRVQDPTNVFVISLRLYCKDIQVI